MFTLLRLSFQEFSESHVLNIIQIIKDLDDLHDFESFLILSPKTFKAEKVIRGIRQKPIVLIGKVNLPWRYLQKTVNKNSLAIVFYKRISSSFLSNFVNHNLRGIHGLKTIFIEISTEFWFRKESQLINNFFTRRGFTAAIHIHERNDSTKVGELVPNLKLFGDSYIDITNLPIEGWFIGKLSNNLSNFYINLPENNNDIPRMFMAPGNGQTTVYGLSGRLFEMFIDFMNIKTFYHQINSSSSRFRENEADVDSVRAFIINDTLDAAPYVHTVYPVDQEYLSYPLEMVTWCLMIPFQKTPSNLYIVYLFENSYSYG